MAITPRSQDAQDTLCSRQGGIRAAPFPAATAGMSETQPPGALPCSPGAACAGGAPTRPRPRAARAVRPARGSPWGRSGRLHAPEAPRTGPVSALRRYSSWSPPGRWLNGHNGHFSGQPGRDHVCQLPGPYGSGFNGPRAVFLLDIAYLHLGAHLRVSFPHPPLPLWRLRHGRLADSFAHVHNLHCPLTQRQRLEQRHAIQRRRQGADSATSSLTEDTRCRRSEPV